MTARLYATPLAFKQALEQRLRSSSATGVDFARRRQLLVFDRFLARLARVAGLTFEFRGTHPVPTRFPPPPEFWAAPYATMAENDDLAWKTLPEVTGAVEIFLNPVLDSAECGTWEPSSWLWKRRA